MGLLNMALSGALIVAGVLVITGELTDLGGVSLIVVAGVVALVLGILMLLGKLEGGLLFGIAAVVGGVLILMGNFPFMRFLSDVLNWVVGGGLIVLGVIRLAKK